MGLTVLLPFELVKDPLVTIETQLSPAAFLGKILFVARIDVLPSLRGRAPKAVQIHPFGQPSLSCIGDAVCWSRRPEIGNGILIWFTTTLCHGAVALFRLQAWAKSDFGLLLI